MNYTKEQFEKLPKWAQSEIKVLSQNIKDLSEKMNQLNGDSETNTYLNDMLDKQPLPKNSVIRFHLGEKNLNHVSVYVNRYGVIDINGDSRLGKKMVIIPQAANAFYIDFI